MVSLNFTNSNLTTSLDSLRTPKIGIQNQKEVFRKRLKVD